MLIPSSRACALLFSVADDILEQRRPRLLRAVHFKRDVLSMDPAVDEHVRQDNFANAGALHPCKPIGVFTNAQRLVKDAYLIKHSAPCKKRLTYVTGRRPGKRVSLQALPLLRQRVDPEILYMRNADSRLRVRSQGAHLALELFRMPGLVRIEKCEEFAACDPQSGVTSAGRPSILLAYVRHVGSIFGRIRRGRIC